MAVVGSTPAPPSYSEVMALPDLCAPGYHRARLLPFELTAHEIASAVLDKGLLGLAAVGFGDWVNRRMEVFRSRRALEAEFLRERTKRLDELHNLMLEVEDTGDKSVLFARKDNAERKALKVNAEMGRAVSADAQERSGGAAREYYGKWWDLTVELRRRAASVRPWIGDALAASCTEYVKVINSSVRMQVREPNDESDGPPDWKSQFEEMKKLKDQAAELRGQIVAEIRKGAPEGSPRSRKA